MVPDKAKLIVLLNSPQEKCFCSWSQWGKDSGHLDSVHTSSHLNYTAGASLCLNLLPPPQHYNDVTLTCFQIRISVSVPTHNLFSCPPSVGWRKLQRKCPRICINLKWSDISKIYDTDFSLNSQPHPHSAKI